MELKHVTDTDGMFVVALLIVPYGIETCIYHLLLKSHLTFNRTLWN